MDLINDPLALRRALNAYAFRPDAPDFAKDKLQAIPGVDADVICEAAEILYAHRDLLDEQGLTIMGQLYGYAVAQGWSGFNQGGRSAAIVAGVRRDLGEKGRFPKPENDPEPDARRRDGGVNWKTGTEPPQAPEAPEPLTPDPAK